ncbi:MAG: D-2-hydroxyacid dehydrogenase [Terriglobales bacterium]
MLKLLIVLHHHFELWNAPDWFAQRLQRDFPQVEVVHFSSYDGVESHLRDAEIIVTWSLRPEQFKLARKLRWIHSPAAAVHQLMFPELIQSDVILSNAREVHGPVVAEHVMALIFALAKQIPQAVRLQEKHVWGQEIMWKGKPRPREVAGATLGLVGVGSIGHAVAKSAVALGMHVIATRENPEKGRPEGVKQVYPATEINMLLERSDYVVLAAPTTLATTGLMSRERLAHMKPEAFLINVGRGPLVDEVALADVLRQRKIGGAALDVFEQEPLPADSPLWDLENLLLTPHTAGLTDRLWERHHALISENLRRYLTHQPMLALVDKTKGY